MTLMIPLSLAAGPPEWLAGCWQALGDRGEVAYTESWSMAVGGAMVGAATSGSTEYLWLGERDGGLVYHARPEGQEPHDFPLILADAERMVFADPLHDFPQRLTYARTASGISIVLEGMKGERAIEVTIPMTACAVPVLPPWGCMGGGEPDPGALEPLGALLARIADDPRLAGPAAAGAVGRRHRDVRDGLRALAAHWATSSSPDRLRAASQMLTALGEPDPRLQARLDAACD